MNSNPDLTQVDEGWAERGWPNELLARARQLHISNGEILRWFSWNAPLKRAEEEVEWAERLHSGTMRFRQLTFADNEAFCALWANAPEQIDEWDVTIERGPNGFASFDLQERPVLNGLFDNGEMVACVSFSIRHTVVGGRRTSVRFGQAMRVHNDHRGHAYAHWVRSLPWAIGLGLPTRVQYDYIRSRNMTMERWNKKFMQDVATVPKRESDVPGVPVTVLQLPATADTGSHAGVRPARASDFGRCVELINRTHAGRDLFRPYNTPWLVDRFEYDVPAGSPWQPPYSVTDFWVVERGGRILACAGLWDRGRDLRERWTHRESGHGRTQSHTSLLDLGYAENADDEMALLIAHLVGVTYELGRDFLTAPLAYLPDVAARLVRFDPTEETRYLQWRSESPALTLPPHLDLVYW